MIHRVNRTQGERHLKFWDSLQGRTFVYVIQGDAGGPIKIGLAKDPLRRMSTLQTGAYETLHLLHVIPGGRLQERTFHDRLKREGCHMGGEWFRGPAVETFLMELHDTAEEMVKACKGSTAVPGVTPTMAPGTNVPEAPEITQARWRRISDCWLGGDAREQIAAKEDLTKAQLDIEILRMRENGYELAEGLTLLQGDDRPIPRTGNFRKLGRGGHRHAA